MAEAWPSESATSRSGSVEGFEINSGIARPPLVWRYALGGFTGHFLDRRSSRFVGQEPLVWDPS